MVDVDRRILRPQHTDNESNVSTRMQIRSSKANPSKVAHYRSNISSPGASELRNNHVVAAYHAGKVCKKQEGFPKDIVRRENAAFRNDGAQ